MGRLGKILNLLVLAIGALIVWHEIQDPPRTEPAPEPTPEPAPAVEAEATADIGTAVPAAESLAEEHVEPEHAVRGDGTNVCPPDFPIKGNASSMIYHAPGSGVYERTVADFCFATAEAAEAAGYRAPRH